MNKSEFENKCNELEKQGHDLVLSYFRSQISEEFPAVVIFYQYSKDWEDNIPIVYAYLITNEEKQNLISETLGSSQKEYEVVTNKFKNSLLWNKNSCLIGHDFGQKFSNLFILNDFSIIEADKILIPQRVELGKRKYRFEYVENQ